MKEKVQAILKIMEFMGVTISDLQTYDSEDIKNTDEQDIGYTGDISIEDDCEDEGTEKFPLEVYYSDNTRSFDVEYSNKGKNRCPIGVVIGRTVYALPDFAIVIPCGFNLRYCKESFSEVATLPTHRQMSRLEKCMASYDDISVFFKQMKLSDKIGKSKRIAIYHKNNVGKVQYYYELETNGNIGHETNMVRTLPVINL